MNKSGLCLIQKSAKKIAGKLKGAGIVILIVCGNVSFQKPKTDSTLIIQFRVYVHGEPLLLNKKYQNPFGETFQINRFRFYAGRFAPVYSGTFTKSNISPLYHLIDFSDSSSTRFELDANEGSCNGIEFQVGIDSSDQVRGAQTGDLDPIKGMFWTWNSGYLTFKIEGYSPVSTQPAHVMAYHIGGYRYAYNTVWKVKLYSTNDATFMISKNHRMMVEIGIDLDYFFDGTTPLHIQETPSCTTTGELARKISGNFIGSFTELIVTSSP